MLLALALLYETPPSFAVTLTEAVAQVGPPRMGAVAGAGRWAASPVAGRWSAAATDDTV